MKTWIGTLTGVALAIMTPSMLLAQSERSDQVAADAISAPSIESVRSAYTNGRDKEVILQVDRALLRASRSTDLQFHVPELYFWKGAAYRRMGEFDQALTALEQAQTLGFDGPELHLEKGLVHRSLGKSQEAERDYQEAEKLFPPDPETRERYLHKWKWDGKDQPRFQAWISPQAGFDSNVIGLNDDTPLLQGDVDFDTFYVGGYLDLKYFLVMNRSQALWLEYQNLARHYADEPDVSFVQNIFSVGGRQPLFEYVDLEVRAALEESSLRDVGHFRTQRTLGPALLMQPIHDLQVRLWGDWSDADYYDNAPKEQDRDGHLVRTGVTFSIDLGRQWSVAPYVTWNRYQAEGDDYDSNGWVVGVSLTPEEVWGIRIVPSVYYGVQSYDNENSLTGFTKKREDKPFGASIAITLKVLEGLIGYAPTITVGYVRHSSNIDEFDYNRWSPQVEVGIAALSF